MPQAVCNRHALFVGAHSIWLVHFFMYDTAPVHTAPTSSTHSQTATYAPAQANVPASHPAYQQATRLGIGKGCGAGIFPRGAKTTHVRKACLTCVRSIIVIFFRGVRLFCSWYFSCCYSPPLIWLTTSHFHNNCCLLSATKPSVATCCHQQQRYSCA